VRGGQSFSANIYHRITASIYHRITASSVAQGSGRVSLDDGEITDKGYVHQRKVLARRAAPVEPAVRRPAPAGVIAASWC
jgi:hypothetical protein